MRSCAHGRKWKRGPVALIATLFLTCMLDTSSVSAQGIEDTPVLNPANPSAGQPVSVELHGNPCVIYFTAPDTPVVVTRNGNSITLLVQAYVSTDPILCNFPNATYAFSIGAYGPGSYTVQVDAQYDPFFGDTITQTLGTLAFDVVVANAVKAVPVLDDVGLMLLVLTLGAAVWIASIRWRLFLA